MPDNDNDNECAKYMGLCVGLGMTSAAVYGWVEFMLYLKQADDWSNTSILLLSLFGPGEAAVGLSACVGSCAIIGTGYCLIKSCLFQKRDPDANEGLLPDRDEHIKHIIATYAATHEV